MSLLDELMNAIPETKEPEEKQEEQRQDTGEKKSMFTYHEDFEKAYGPKR
jgi:hypothetical protein